MIDRASDTLFCDEQQLDSHRLFLLGDRPDGDIQPGASLPYHPPDGRGDHPHPQNRGMAGIALDAVYHQADLEVLALDVVREREQVDREDLADERLRLCRGDFSDKAIAEVFRGEDGEPPLLDRCCHPSENSGNVYKVSYTSRFATSCACCSMNCFRGSTSSPIRSVNILSASTASSIVTKRVLLLPGSMVVSQSWSGFISPRPL